MPRNENTAATVDAPEERLVPHGVRRVNRPVVAEAGIRRGQPPELRPKSRDVAEAPWQLVLFPQVSCPSPCGRHKFLPRREPRRVSQRVDGVFFRSNLARDLSSSRRPLCLRAACMLLSYLFYSVSFRLTHGRRFQEERPGAQLGLTRQSNPHWKPQVNEDDRP